MRSLLILLLALAASINQGFATSVTQMNLADMAPQAEKIFRGTLVDVSSSKVAVGGGEISALTYKFRVSEVFKGQVDTVKGVQVAEVKMIGTLDKQRAGKHIIEGFPTYKVGQEYLMFVAPAGGAGLTSTMGLGQGSFKVFYQGKQAMVVNEYNNINLLAPSSGQQKVFRQDSQQLKQGSAGPVRYEELADQIKSLITQ